MLSVLRKYIVNLALKLQGVPYIWGGDNPQYGFDCSGFVIWVLQVFEILPSGDWTANDLAKYFPATESPDLGDLVCYGPSEDSVTHIGLYIGGSYTVMATGGGSKTTTEEIARQTNAKVKIKPVAYRSDFLYFRSIARNGNSNT